VRALRLKIVREHAGCLAAAVRLHEWQPVVAATDFRAMPLEETSEAHAALVTWGNDDIDWLVTNVLTHLDADTLKAEALRVRFFVREHNSQWMLEHNVYGEDGKVDGTEKRLTLTGEESIAATLFTEPQRILGGVPAQFLELLDFMISFRFTQCDTERVGRTMTLTKPALRSSLGDLHFKQACWVAYNSPGFRSMRSTSTPLCGAGLRTATSPL